MDEPYLLAIGAPRVLSVPCHLAKELQETVQRVTVAGGQQEEQQLQHSQLLWALHGWTERSSLFSAVPSLLDTYLQLDSFTLNLQ